ncbi:MAG TPA: hypothetical protein VIF14_00465, partial [Alphaproteobacteria bacterium]
GKASMPAAAEAGRGRYDPALLRAIDAALQLRTEERPQSIAALRAIMRGEPRGAPVVAEPGATLVAGPSRATEASLVRMEPGATLVSGGRPDRGARTEAAAAEPPRAEPRGMSSLLRKAGPAHVAFAAGVVFAALIGLVVLIVVLMSGSRP